MKKTISIIGGGWLGLALAKKLQSYAGVRIKISSTSKDKLLEYEKLNLQPYMIKMEESSFSLDTHIGDFFSTNVLIICFPPKRIANIEDVHLKQYKNLLQQVHSNIKQIIMVSSTSVYQTSNGVVDESTILHPEKASGKALILCENLIKKKFPKQYLILRAGGLYGPNRPIGRFLAGKKIVVNEKEKVNLIHQQDIINIMEILIEKEIKQEVFNIVSTNHPLRLDLYNSKALELGLELPLFQIDNERKYKIVSSEKLVNLINYKFIY